MFVVCPLHANYMSIGSTTANTTTTIANSFSLPKSSLLLYGRDFLIMVGITRSKVIIEDPPECRPGNVGQVKQRALL